MPLLTDQCVAATEGGGSSLSRIGNIDRALAGDEYPSCVQIMDFRKSNDACFTLCRSDAKIAERMPYGINAKRAEFSAAVNPQGDGLRFWDCHVTIRRTQRRN